MKYTDIITDQAILKWVSATNKLEKCFYVAISLSITENKWKQNVALPK